MQLVHTFMLLNKEGKRTLVKFHWKPTCGKTVNTKCRGVAIEGPLLGARDPRTLSKYHWQAARFA
jgi:catalase